MTIDPRIPTTSGRKMSCFFSPTVQALIVACAGREAKSEVLSGSREGGCATSSDKRCFPVSEWPSLLPDLLRTLHNINILPEYRTCFVSLVAFFVLFFERTCPE